MNIVYYKDPPKYMPHMYEKGLTAPVVAQVVFEETPPTAQEIAAAKARTPAKMKLIGNTFVKKPEEVFGFFIGYPFFNMYQNQMATDWSGKTIGALDLPIRDTDYAMKQLVKRIPYDGISVDRTVVQAFVDTLNDTVKRINSTLLNGADHPKATYNCYETTDIQSEPFGEDVQKQIKSKYILMHTVNADLKVNLCLCYKFDFIYYVIKAGKAWVPLRIFPVFADSAAPAANAAAMANPAANAAANIRRTPADWLPLVDRLAHYQSMAFDRSEETAMGDSLLAGGDAALQAIMSYLIGCAHGRQSEYWWSDAAYLVKLIAKFPGADHAQLYNILMSQQTNIWEYHTQIKDVAEQELLNLKKSAPGFDSSVISAANAQAELKKLYNMHITEDERLKRALAMRPSVERWSDESKAFYYYIIGDALRIRSRNDPRQYPFYAAQIFYQPDKTSMGWYNLRNLEQYKSIPASPENAKLLHEQLPLPDVWDDLLTPYEAQT